eukprot:g31303.t1
MNRRPDLAFPREILSRSDRGLFLEKNRLQNGELWMKSAAALPGKERFHVTKQQDRRAERRGLEAPSGSRPAEGDGRTLRAGHAKLITANVGLFAAPLERVGE